MRTPSSAPPTPTQSILCLCEAKGSCVFEWGWEGDPLFAVGNVDAKGTSRGALLAAAASGGRISPQEVDKNFLVDEFWDRRVDLDVLGCVLPFPHVFGKK